MNTTPSLSPTSPHTISYTPQSSPNNFSPYSRNIVTTPISDLIVIGSKWTTEQEESLNFVFTTPNKDKIGTPLPLSSTCILNIFV